jgi:hypothetical protein
MRITNITSFSKYFSYASKAGKTIMPGESSAELPFETLHNKNLWVDINAGSVKLTLGDNDREFIARIMSADAKVPVKVVASSTTKTRKQIVADRRANFQKTQESLNRLAAKGVKINYGGASGQPQFGQDTIVTPPMPHKGSAIPNVITGTPPSIDDIKRHNQAVKQVKRAAIPANVPMNPRGVLPGQPSFSQGVGPGNEDQGVGRKGPDTMANAAALLGGRL